MKAIKKKLATLVALILIASMVMPVAAHANPMDNVPQRIEDNQVFVQLRAAAYAHGWDVVWHSETREVSLINDVGFVETLLLADLVAALGGFVERGVTWIPIELAMAIFNAINMALHLDEDARDIALADFDFLTQFILDNTAWEDMIGRSFGISFIEVMEFFRDFIEQMEPIFLSFPEQENYDHFRTLVPYHSGLTAQERAANHLFLVLNDLSIFFGGFGHLGVRFLNAYNIQAIGITRLMNNLAEAGVTSHSNNLRAATFLAPQAVWFYGEVDASGDNNPTPIVEGNITTSVFNEAGQPSVAYLRFETFMTDLDYDDAILLPFLQEVADFDHLIIDVRGNGGGFIYYVTGMITRRLLNEPTEFGSFEFFRGGDEALAMMEAILADSQASESEEIELMYARIMDAATFVAERNMTKFNQADLALLDYVMVSRSLVHPSYDAVGFDGDIWLLIDGNSASASSLLADMMQYAGMATLVGTNTSVVMGTTHLYVSLPNTGIIWRADIGYTTDAYGQSLEFYGIAPDVRVPFGRDALDLALSLILGTIMNDDITDDVTEEVADDIERGPLYFPGFPQIPTFITVSNNAEYVESGTPAFFGLSSGDLFYDYLILYAISSSAWIPDTDAYDVVLANLGFSMQSIDHFGSATWVFFYNAALDISLAYSFDWEFEMLFVKIGPGNVYAQLHAPIIEDVVEEQYDDDQDEDEYQDEDHDQDEDEDEDQENATDEGTTAFTIPAGARDLLNDSPLRIVDLSHVTVADSGFRINSVAHNADYVAAANEVRLSILGRFDTFNWSAAHGSPLDAIFILVNGYDEDTFRPLQSFLMPQTNTDGTAAFLHIAYTDVRDFAPRSVVFVATINDSGTLEMSMFMINWNHMNDDALARLHALSDALGINIVQRITSDMNSVLNMWEMMANR